MPSNIDLDALFALPPEEEDSFQREDRCRKALKTVGKAIFMRLFVVALLIFIAVTAKGNAGVLLLLVLVSLINLGGVFPLVKEWKIRKEELNQLLEEE